MRFICYLLSLSVFSYCGCSDAAPKEKIPELVCPYVLPAEKDFPSSWVILGKLSTEQLQLRSTAVIDGNALEEKERLSNVKERVFSKDIIEEWDDFKDRSEAIAEYPEDHRDSSMMCTYGRSIAEANDSNRNVVLLIPLPQKKPVTCLLVRRDVDPTHEISCKVK